MVKPQRTSYPVSFRINFKEDGIERVREAAAILGQPSADIIRDGADKYARRIINDQKRVQKGA